MLTPGIDLGPYRIESLLGAGGMGEVYRARDTRLGRIVAIKILPDSFAADGERRARFEREARTLASLNHPNIAALYGVETIGSTPALVMELVAGPTLAEQPPVERADILDVARQIAEALEAAHDAGIVHRDLKPANVKRRPDGVVKVLDFGLAKIVAHEAVGAADATMSSAGPNTALGLVLGTAGYMSPEQARGRPVDKRTDIWSFGVVLFEWLSGRRLFDGETVNDAIAAVLDRDPDWSALPTDLPASVAYLLQRCLERDPRKRLRDIGEARLVLTDPSATVVLAPLAPSAATGSKRSRWRPVGMAAALAVGVAGIAWGTRASHSDRLPLMQFDVQVSGASGLPIVEQPSLAIAPDGRTIAFVAADHGVRRLYLRRRDEADAHVVPGTDGVEQAAFSPGGRTIAFDTPRELKRVVPGESPVTLTRTLSTPRGFTWLDAQSLAYTPVPLAGLFRIGLDGGEPAALTNVDVKSGERTHRWPAGLPDGKAVLFVVGSIATPDSYDDAEVQALVLATGERRRILSGASFVRYLPPGYLLFARGGSLYVVPFDADALKVTGTPALVPGAVAVDPNTGAAQFAAADGTLIYAPGTASYNLRRLVWVDREGRAAPIDLAPAVFNDPRLSPDGTRVAYIDGPIGRADVWVYDLRRAVATRLTHDAKSVTPVWSADGRRVYYASIDAQMRTTTIFRRAADGSRPAERVASMDRRVELGGIGARERRLFASVGDWASFFDVAVLSIDTAVPALQPLAASKANEFGVAPSPDGNWIAYASDETGLLEIYVRPSSGGGGRWQVSTGGGDEAHWSADGRTLYFRAGTRIMSAAVGRDGSPGRPVEVITGAYALTSETSLSFDVDAKTGRFLMIRPVDDRAGEPLRGFHVVLNWTHALPSILGEPR